MRKRISTLAALAIIAGAVAGPSAAQASPADRRQVHVPHEHSRQYSRLLGRHVHYTWNGKKKTSSSTNLP